jgi:nitrite reductase (NADH) small subunit
MAKQSIGWHVGSETVVDSVREVRVAEWVRLCGVEDVPKVGEVMVAEAKGVAVCVANVEGRLCALNNVCPHRGGPLGEGWVEGEAVVCPWHSWAFSTTTGVAEAPEKGKVDVYPVKVEGGDLMVDLG